jgi:methyl-galactoside transport system substrate-binding protein
MKKKLLIVLLAVVLTLSMAACAGAPSTAGSPSAAAPSAAAPSAAAPESSAAAPSEAASAAPAGKELNIGVLVWKFDDAYGSTVRTAMTKYAEQYGKELGIKINLEMQDANDSMATQNDQAEIMFAAKKDFVIINLAEVASGQSLIDKAKANNVPFLFYNKEPTDPTIISKNGSIFVGTTPREAGDMQGEILADLYAKDKSIDKNGDGKLQYIMFMGEPNNAEAIARTKYSVDTAQAKGLKLEQLGETLVCNWDQAQAQDAMTASFANYGKKIEVIFANNDMMGLGAIAALNASNYNTGNKDDPSVVVIGVDAVDAALEAIKAGKMTATVQQDGDAMGKAVIQLAINGAQKKDWLAGTQYKLSADGYSIRIPYAKITE